jgi:glycosyltransferase involved in cell wall biosynthesis
MGYELKISVITVCKNAVKTIEETILSVLNQSYQNIEYIVIDGVSTDGTLEIIKKYENKITKLISEPDSGVYNAMNKGISMATGDILYFINANDTVYDNYVFEKITNYFQKDNELEFLFGDFQFTTQSKTNGSVVKHNKVHTIFTFVYYNICHQAIFYRSRVFREYGLYDESYKIFADYELNVKLLVENRLKAKYLNLLISKFEEGGISTAKNDEILKKHSDERKRIYSKYFKKYHFILFILSKTDRFFMKFFGTPYKIIKNKQIILKIQGIMLDFINNIYKIKLNLS